MTEMRNCDTESFDELKRLLTEYCLDPHHELVGDFVNPSPQWDDPEINEKYKGCTKIAGNFLLISHSFYILTNDIEQIKELETLIRANQQRPDYKIARNKLYGKEKT